MWRAISIIGMLLLVVAYLANQRGVIAATSRSYLIANTVGAALLAAYSAFIGEWVFVALEGFWSAAALYTLAQELKRPKKAPERPPEVVVARGSVRRSPPADDPADRSEPTP